MSAIPSLTRAHIEAAMARIDREGAPRRRQSAKFHLQANGRRYPPKYVVSLAASYATGRELRPDEFSGGDETNGLLVSLGFTIVGPGTGPAKVDARKPRVASPTQAVTKHPVAQPKSKRSAPPKREVAATIVRVVVQGRPASSARAAAEMLVEAFGKWPTRERAKFTITPGGFITGKFPSRWSGGISWESSSGDLDMLVAVAKPLVDACVTKKVLAAARPLTSTLTIGVDLLSDVEHAELVALIDCDSGETVRWTGKSYPTGGQEATLVQVCNIGSHLVEIANERVLILGCHDLNMFSARARANQSPGGIRRQRCNEMARATARFNPTVVLQHPHSTDSANIWRMPWACLTREYPSVRTYASGIGYFRWNGPARRPLREVLAGTRSEFGVADVVVNSR